MTDYWVSITYAVQGATDDEVLRSYEALLFEAWAAWDEARQPSSRADFREGRVTLDAVYDGGTPEAAIGRVRIATASIVQRAGGYEGVRAGVLPVIVHAELWVGEAQAERERSADVVIQCQNPPVELRV